MRGWLLTKDDDGQKNTLGEIDEAGLPEGDVTIEVDYSTINYKDGLAITGKGPVVRNWPMVPGIDGAGKVIESSHADFKPGDEVIQNGWGVGEVHWGCLAEKARLKGDWLIHKPAGFTGYQAMAIGTAGYTAMLCVMALERNGIMPDAGPVLVTGAGGGVGGTAVALLSKLGYHVIVSSGRPELDSYFTRLGASEIIPREELSEKGRALGKERWAGVVDSVGSTTLANAIAQTKYGGCVAACGLAQGADLPATVMPFILRAVTLAGVDSVMCDKSMRIQAWERLEHDLEREKLELLTAAEVPLREAEDKATDILEGRIRGRVVVNVRA